MTRQTLKRLMLIMAGLALTGLAGGAEQNGSGRAGGTGCSSGADLLTAGVTKEWHYTLTVRVRPLLFWIGCGDVGGARVAWTEGYDGSKVAELLVGSDPARAPMRVNRWGYIGERVAGPKAQILGVMTASDEESVGQAKAAVSDKRASHRFKAIRGCLSDGLAYSTVIHMILPDDFTYRDADLLFRQLPQAGPLKREQSVPPGLEPGFLFAMKSLLRESVDRYNRLGRTSGQRAQRVYVYNATLYELIQEPPEFLPEITVGGHTYRAAIESTFGTRNMTTGQTSSFTVTYGVRPPIEETPVRIVYRPRWWFEAELSLQEDAGTSQAAGRGSSWKPPLR